MSNLAFLDVETTGLDKDLDNPEPGMIPWLLEVGLVIVSTPTFDVVAKTNAVLPFKRGQGTKVHPKVLAMHEANGLWKECETLWANQGRHESFRYEQEQRLIQFLHQHDAVDSQLCGFKPGFDRNFLRRYMPKLEREFHYRDFDCNSFFLLQSYLTGVEPKREKPASHRAVDDCMDAIASVENHFNFFCNLVKGEYNV
jgi:oligoribonuclease (3'-5' exoribonuclease)